MEERIHKKGFTLIIVLVLVVVVFFSPLAASSVMGLTFGSHAREGTPAEGGSGAIHPENQIFGEIPSGPCGQAIADLAASRVGQQAVDYFPQDPGHACAVFVAQVVNPIAQPPPALGYSAQGQWDSSAGTQINRTELSTGDVIYFQETYDNGRIVTHEGIYHGNGRFIDSGGTAGPGGTQTVRWNSLSDFWGNHYYGAKRYCLEEEVEA